MGFFGKKTYNGITSKTTKHLQLDAGAFFMNFEVGKDTYESAKKAGKCLGATQGGGTFTAKLLFTLMSALAQFERDVLADRTREGLAAAKARGKKGGRPPADKEQLRKAIKLYSTGQYSLAEIDEMTGIKRSTLYRSITRSKNV